MRDYKKYDIWKLSHLLTLEVYKITESFPKEEIFGLTSQIRRASSSIGINIVEGCGRGSDEAYKIIIEMSQKNQLPSAEAEKLLEAKYQPPKLLE